MGWINGMWVDDPADYGAQDVATRAELNARASSGQGADLLGFLGRGNRGGTSMPIYPDVPHRRGEHIPDWRNAVDRQAYNESVGGGKSYDVYALMADAERQMAAAREPDYRSSLEDMIRERMNAGSGGGSGVSIQSLIDAANQSYDQAVQQAQQAKAASQQGIQGAYDLFNTNIGRNYADYSQAQQASQAAMAARLAQQIADATTQQGQLQASAASMGQDVGALKAQQAGNLAALQAAGGFQQDLGQRLAQIVANNQRALQGSGELVRQGATGNLENAYNSLINALTSQRDQQIAAARSGGGGGGGGSKQVSYLDALKEILGEVKTQKELDQLLSGETPSLFDQISPDKLFEAYLSAAADSSPEGQARAAMLADRLGMPS